MANIMPIIPPTIDSWRSGLIATMATAITTTAPRRSSHGARLKNVHHTMTATVPASPAITPRSEASGMTSGSANLASTMIEAAITPGQRRSGFRSVAGQSVKRTWFIHFREVQRVVKPTGDMEKSSPFSSLLSSPFSLDTRRPVRRKRNREAAGASVDLQRL